MYNNTETLMDEKFQYLYLLLPECIAEGFAVPLHWLIILNMGDMGYLWCNSTYVILNKLEYEYDCTGHNIILYIITISSYIIKMLLNFNYHLNQFSDCIMKCRNICPGQKSCVNHFLYILTLCTYADIIKSSQSFENGSFLQTYILR